MPDLQSALYRDENQQTAPRPQSKDLDKLTDKCHRMVKHAQPVTEAWLRLYDDALNYAFNNQLSEKRRKRGWPRVQMNMIYPALKQEISILAQRKPAIRARPRKTDEDTQQSKNFWEGNLQHRFENDLKMPEKMIKGTLDGGLGGWAIAYIWPNEQAKWDAKANKYRYRPEVTLLNPRFFGVDPNAETIEDAEYVYCKRMVSLDWAISMWPEREAELRSAAAELAQEQDKEPGLFPISQLDGAHEKGEEEPGDRGYGHETRASMWKEGQLVNLIRNAHFPNQLKSGEGKDSNIQRVMLITVYFKDRGQKVTTEYRDYTNEELLMNGAVRKVEGGVDEVFLVENPEAPEFDNMKERPKKGQMLNFLDWPRAIVSQERVPKFPYGRCIYMAGKWILNRKEEDQVWDRERWPFEIYVRIFLPHSPHGLNAVEMPRSCQDWVNVTASHLLNWLMYFGDPITIVEEDAIKPGTKLSAKAGAIWRVLTGRANAVRREPAPPLSEGVVSIFDKMIRGGQDAQGMHDQALGAPVSGGQRTAQEVAYLNQATQIGMGLPMIALDDWVKRIMWHVVELDKEYLEIDEAVQMSGPQFTKDMIVKFMDKFSEFDFDIDLEVGAQLPLDKQARKEDAITLYKISPSNPEGYRNLLDAFEIHNKEAWIQGQADVATVMALQAQREAAAKTAAPGAAAGPAAPEQMAPPVPAELTPAEMPEM